VPSFNHFLFFICARFKKKFNSLATLYSIMLLVVLTVCQIATGREPPIKINLKLFTKIFFIHYLIFYLISVL